MAARIEKPLSPSLNCLAPIVVVFAAKEVAEAALHWMYLSLLSSANLIRTHTSERLIWTATAAAAAATAVAVAIIFEDTIYRETEEGKRKENRDRINKHKQTPSPENETVAAA